MTRRLGGTRSLVLVLLLMARSVAAAEQYSVTGMVVSVDRSRNMFTASIEEIPRYMRAMTMPFEVRQAKELDALSPGAIVEFTLIVEPRTAYAERLRIVRYQNVEQDPFTASRLALLNQIVSGAGAVESLGLGELGPNFTLTDQENRPVAVSDFRGKDVA